MFCLFKGKFAEPMLASQNQTVPPPKRAASINVHQRISKTSSSTNRNTQPPVPPVRKKKAVKDEKQVSINNTTTTATARPKYIRSQTFIEPRRSQMSKQLPSNIMRSTTGLPFVTGEQRHALSLLRMTDLFSYGINGSLRPCATAKRVCHLLIDFVQMITAAKRKMLEQAENFYKISIQENGERKKIPLNRHQQRSARKRIIEDGIFSTLPGKLDHASCVAWKVPQPSNQTALLSIHVSIDSNFKETNF